MNEQIKINLPKVRTDGTFRCFYIRPGVDSQPQAQDGAHSNFEDAYQASIKFCESRGAQLLMVAHVDWREK